MNSKIYVVVTVPMLEKNIDLYIPTTKKVGTIKNLIVQIIEEVIKPLLMIILPVCMIKKQGKK